MEITLNIPQNTWEKPTEVRQEVVQLICDTFLKGKTWWSLYNAVVENPYYGEMDFADNSDYKWGEKYKGKRVVEFHECEMRMAFKALRKAGYLFEAGYRYGSTRHKYYKLTKRNYAEGCNTWIVIDFNEEWD